MNKYFVAIPDWSEGKPLYFEGVEAESAQGAEQKVVDWVNRRAGYRYCDRLPTGSVVKLTEGEEQPEPDHRVG